jgi:hypothetical protein
MNNVSTSQLFAKSFLYMFGLSDNPIKSMLKQRNEIDDMEMIQKDWEMVGKDILNAFDYENSKRREANYSN